MRPRITDPMFSVDWHFLTSKGQLESASIEEMADDVLYDEAYPEIAGGVASFIDRYLRSKEAILVLQGAPGTGRTRLIRAALGEISRREGDEARIAKACAWLAMSGRKSHSLAQVYRACEEA